MFTPKFFGQPECWAGRRQTVGVIISNLGTPDAPTAPALRKYLKQFLADPRVIEVSRPLWWVILNGIILNTRPRQSAKLYKKIWTEDGSPLLSISRKQEAQVRKRLEARFGSDIRVELAMRYGSPSIEDTMKKLSLEGVSKFLVIPLYPQYSATTSATTIDEVTRVLSTWRWIPELRTVMQYHDHPRYIAALANSIREVWDRDGMPDKLVLSYHGVPLRYLHGGDPYHCHCHKTSRLLAEALGISKDQDLTCFQSVFGRERWLRPATIDTIEELAKQGLKKLDVICPGFSVDCLETIEEIDELNREVFLHNGGEKFRYIPCLNDRKDSIDLIEDLIVTNLQGWIDSVSNQTQETLSASRASYEAQRASGENII